MNPWTHGAVYCRGMPATTPSPDDSTPPAPRHVSAVLPDDVAEQLHLLAFRTGRSKQDLVIAALRKTYGWEQP